MNKEIKRTDLQENDEIEENQEIHKNLKIHKYHGKDKKFDMNQERLENTEKQ